MSEVGMNKSLRHVTVLEEAHNLLRKVSTSQSMETANVAGKSVEMITNSIAEMRTYGESFIIVDQSPSMLDSAAIRNTNTKIVLSLPDTEDRKVAGGAMSLSEEQIDEIARQNQGEAIVYQNHWEEPVQCKVDDFSEQVKDSKEFIDGYVYTKSTPFNKKPKRVYKTEVVEFLLYPYLKKEFDIDYVAASISESEMPTAIRFSLMDLVEEYRNSNELSIWKDYNFAELSIVLKQYLNLDSEYANITSQYTNMKQVRTKLDVILKERFNQDLYRAFLYYVEMCYVRNNALYEDWRKTF
jgi:hypothetical protein